MVPLGVKKGRAAPRLVSFRGLIKMSGSNPIETDYGLGPMSDP